MRSPEAFPIPTKKLGEEKQKKEAVQAEQKSEQPKQKPEREKEEETLEIKEANFWPIVRNKTYSILREHDIEKRQSDDDLTANTMEALYFYTNENKLDRLTEAELDTKLRELFQKERKLLSRDYFSLKYKEVSMDAPIQHTSHPDATKQRLVGDTIANKEATVLEKMIEREEALATKPASLRPPASLRLEEAYINGTERERQLVNILKGANLNDLSVHELELLSKYFVRGNFLKGPGQWHSQDAVKNIEELMFNERKELLINIGLTPNAIKRLATNRPMLVPIATVIKQLNNLYALGFKDPMVIIRRYPFVVTRTEKSISEKIKFFEKIGIDDPLRLIEINPWLLSSSIESMTNRIKQFERMGISNIPKLIKRNCFFLLSGKSPERFIRMQNYLKEQGMKNPLRFIENNPLLMNLNFERFKQKIVNLSRFGFRNPIGVLEKAPMMAWSNVDMEKLIVKMERVLRFFAKEVPEMKNIHAVDIIEGNPERYLGRGTDFLSTILRANVFLHTYFPEFFELTKEQAHKIFLHTHFPKFFKTGVSKWQNILYHNYADIETFNRLAGKRVSDVVLAIKDLVADDNKIKTFPELIKRIKQYRKEPLKNMEEELNSYINLYNKQPNNLRDEKHKAFAKVLFEYQKFAKQKEAQKERWSRKSPDLKPIAIEQMQNSGESES